jgi:hypothetical protein
LNPKGLSPLSTEIAIPVDPRLKTEDNTNGEIPGTNAWEWTAIFWLSLRIPKLYLDELRAYRFGVFICTLSTNLASKDFVGFGLIYGSRNTHSI